MLGGFALVSCFARARDRHHHIISFTMPSMRSPPSHWYTPSLGTPVPVNQAMPASIRPFHFHKCTPTTLVAYVCRSFKYYGMHQWDAGARVAPTDVPKTNIYHRLSYFIYRSFFSIGCQRRKTTAVFSFSFADLSFLSVGKFSMSLRLGAPRGAAQTLKSAAQTLKSRSADITNQQRRHYRRS